MTDTDKAMVNRNLWLAGHVLSLMGLIDEACKMRDLSWQWDGNESKSSEQAESLLMHIHVGDPTIDAWLKSIIRHTHIRSVKTQHNKIGAPFKRPLYVPQKN